VPEEYYTLPIGKANVVKSGEELSIIAYGAAVHWAKDVINEHEIDADLIDLRSLMPLDFEAIAISVQKTGRVLIIHEDSITGGIGAEISAYISEHLFEYLDAPVKRLGALDTPVPFAIALEQNFLPKSRLKNAIEELLAF
jgi:2-oxoisovalerate dehydrogenase E1 component